MTTIGVGSSAILILCFFHEESGKGVAGLWRGCGRIVEGLLLSARYTFRLRATAMGGDGCWREGRGERRLLKVGGKFGSAAKLTQLSSPLLKRNFAASLRRPSFPLPSPLPATLPIPVHLSSLPPFSLSNDERFLLDIPAVCPEK